MGLDVKQFREHIVTPTLRYLEPEIRWSLSAEKLLVAIPLHESRLTYLDQLTPGPGPAFGLFQIEPATHRDLWSSYVEFRPALAHKLRNIRAPWPSGVEQLRTNLAYACAIARVILYRRPEALPPANDHVALGAYAKRFYNSMLGKATADDYIVALNDSAGVFA